MILHIEIHLWYMVTIISSLNSDQRNKKLLIISCCRPLLKSSFFIYIRGAGSTREVWGGGPSPCVGPAVREVMLLTAETGKQVMACPGRQRGRSQRRKRLGLPRKRGEQQLRKKSGGKRETESRLRQVVKGPFTTIFFESKELGTQVTKVACMLAAKPI